MDLTRISFSSTAIMIYAVTVSYYSKCSPQGIILNLFFLLSTAVCIVFYIFFITREKINATDYTVSVYIILNCLYLFLSGEVYLLFKSAIDISLSYYFLENIYLLRPDIIPVLRLIPPFHIILFVIAAALCIELNLFIKKTRIIQLKELEIISYIFFTALFVVPLSLQIVQSFNKNIGNENEFRGVNFSRDSKLKYRGEGHFKKKYGFNITGKPDIVIFILESVGSEYFDFNRTKYFRSGEPVVTVNNFFVPVPHTTPSIYSILTGNYGDYRNRQRLNEAEGKYSLPTLLKEYDYRPLFFYSGPVYFENLNFMLGQAGFDVYDMEYYKNKKNPVTGLPYSSFSWGVDDMALFDEVASLRIDKSSPLFLCIGFSSTHSPYFNPAKEFFNRYDNSTVLGRYRNCIDYEIYIIDKIVQLMLSSNSNTIFIITGDHGESFGEHGFVKHSFSLYNSELKVPFSIRHSLLQKINSSNSGSIIDLYPTLIDLLGISQPVEVNGRSIFSYGYNLKLFISSWKHGDSKGMIFNDTKFLYSRTSDTLYEMDLNDNVKADISSVTGKNGFIRFLDMQY